MSGGAELVSEQAEQLLNLWHRQHWFDIVGEYTGVHLGHKGQEQKIDKNGKYITFLPYLKSNDFVQTDTQLFNQ